MEELKPHNVPIDGADIENLIDLPYLNEPEILSYLSKRYGKNMIYTYTGAILIAINPFDVIKPDSRYALQRNFTPPNRSICHS